MPLVRFCLACVDQAPWTSDDVRPSPTGGPTAEVQQAQRLSNLTTDAEGRPRRMGRPRPA